jgi:methylated-DNA-[protein]-cysteine S-methyltransferase
MEILLTADEKHLTGVYYADSKHVPPIEDDWQADPGHPVLKEAVKQIEEFLAGKRKDFSIDLVSTGTPFQREVWKQIARIPFGQTISYAELAKRAGNPTAIRAAGAATGANPLSIVVPCHRVVGKNGAITGYAGGTNRKVTLLEIESR